MKPKFKKYTSVQYTDETKEILRKICEDHFKAENKGTVLSVKWDERPDGHYYGSTFIYQVEFENGEVRGIAENHIEEIL